MSIGARQLLAVREPALGSLAGQTELSCLTRERERERQVAVVRRDHGKCTLAFSGSVESYRPRYFCQ